MSAYPPVEELLPHGPEARCVDRIVDFVPGGALTAELDVRPGLVLYDARREGIPAWGGIEIMAQAAGLRQGLVARSRGAGRPRLGYLIGVREFRAAAPLLAHGKTLEIVAECRAADAGGLARFECRIRAHERECVSALLTVWRAPDNDEGEE